MNIIETEGLTKRFGRTVALDGVTTVVPRGSVVGLIGRNGSGKTTLLRLAAGLLVADAGRCLTLGVPSEGLGPAELVRLGVVHQHDPLLPFMKVGKLIDYVASFYPGWDRELEHAAMELLELERGPRVGALSPGNRQRLALVLALGHRPELLLLDEPLSDLDPMARSQVMALLLSRFVEDGTTMVISSHLLADLEPVVERILCLHEGRITADEELDTLKERFAEWVVTSANGALPAAFPETFVRSAQVEGRRAVVLVEGAGPEAARAFGERHGVVVEPRGLNLDRLFPVLTERAG